MKIQINPYITYNEIDESFVILNENGTKIFSLNTTASRIWKEIVQGKEIDEIAHALSKEYNADFAKIKNDLMILLSSLNKDGIIILKE